MWAAFMLTLLTDSLKGMPDERQNWAILSADRPIKSAVCHAKIARFCRLTFCISDNKFCLCCHGDCLRRKMNTYFSYLLCLLLFSFIRYAAWQRRSPMVVNICTCEHLYLIIFQNNFTKANRKCGKKSI